MYDIYIYNVHIYIYIWFNMYIHIDIFGHIINYIHAWSNLYTYIYIYDSKVTYVWMIHKWEQALVPSNVRRHLGQRITLDPSPTRQHEHHLESGDGTAQPQPPSHITSLPTVHCTLIVNVTLLLRLLFRSDPWWNSGEENIRISSVVLSLRRTPPILTLLFIA